MSSIKKRLTAAVTDLEHQIWRALRENSSAVVPYLAKDCIMMFHDGEILDSQTDPSLTEYLESEELAPWASFEIYDVRVSEVDMMAAVVCYRMVAKRAVGRSGALKTYHGRVSSTWRQDASGDWKLCVHHQALT
jgi:ketosteroid isomerase-like protein